MREQQLRRIFRHALALASVTNVGAAMGCSPASSQPPPGPTPPVVTVAPNSTGPTVTTPSSKATTPPGPTGSATPQNFPATKLCTSNEGDTNPLAEVKDAVGADYIELRQVSRFRNKNASSSGRPLHRAGMRCAGAAANSKCEQDFAALTFSKGFNHGCGQIACTHHVIYTKGEELKVLSSLDEVKQFLGPIDSPGDAILWAFANGYNTASCATLAEKPVVETKAGYQFEVTKLISDCPWTTHKWDLAVATDATISFANDLGEKKTSMCAGRLPPGLHATQHCDETQSAAASHLTEMAHMEAASVLAFEQLVRELTAHGAPTPLIDAAASAADDERRHAASVGAFAVQLGATIPDVVVDEVPVRSLLAIALDNATEGCVRETYGALFGHHQAQHSNWPAFAAAMRTIAEDETAHAAFSWNLSDWLDTQLTEDERQQVLAARKRSAATMADGAATPQQHELNVLLGRPTPAQARQLRHVLTQSLWS